MAMVMTAPRSTDLRATLRHYYESDTPESHRFRYALLAYDLLTVVFIVTTSFLPRTPNILAIPNEGG